MYQPASPLPAPARVLILGSYGPSLINFRGPLIATLVAKGHTVFACAPDIDAETSRGLDRLGAQPKAIKLSRSGLNPAAMMRTRRQLRALFEETKPDVVLAYTIKPIVLGATAARAAGVAQFIPMITGLGYAFLGGLRPRRLLIRASAKAMYRRALRHAPLVIFQNADDAGDFVRMSLVPKATPRLIVNGSGVDLERFRPCPVPESPAVLMIARFLVEKGIREFAQAAKRLKASHPDVPVRVVGWLDESPDSIDQAELDAMIESGVEWLGKLDDVRSALAGCSVYVLPSYREGTPRSVLEALAVGRAIVTTDVPGCRETVVAGTNGLLVPARDADALYDAMRTLVENHKAAIRMGAASRRLAEEKYDVDKVNAEIVRALGL